MIKLTFMNLNLRGLAQRRTKYSTVKNAVSTKTQNFIFLLKNTFYNPKLSVPKYLCIMGKITFFGYLRFFCVFPIEKLSITSIV